MSSPVRITALAIGCSVLLLVGCREEPKSHDEIVRADLTEIMEIQGADCGEVKSFEARGALDYTIRCANGNRYRIHVSAEGRVNVGAHGD